MNLIAEALPVVFTIAATVVVGGVPAAVLLGRLGPLLFALNYFCCFRQKPLRNVMDDHPASSDAEKSVLDAVLAAYRQVLDDPGVSPDDDFFELGGDSFQAMDIMAALEETIGKQINAGVIFAFPTATGLAAAIMKTADASS